MASHSVHRLQQGARVWQTYRQTDGPCADTSVVIGGIAGAIPRNNNSNKVNLNTTPKRQTSHRVCSVSETNALWLVACNVGSRIRIAAKLAKSSVRPRKSSWAGGCERSDNYANHRRSQHKYHNRYFFKLPQKKQHSSMDGITSQERIIIKRKSDVSHTSTIKFAKCQVKRQCIYEWDKVINSLFPIFDESVRTIMFTSRISCCRFAHCCQLDRSLRTTS